MSLTAAGIRPRRKPSQSRAWATSQAIQDAFLILLLEKGYESVSIRDIAGVAGVGIGTLYLYYPNKESIAAVTVRSRVRQLASALVRARDAHGPRTVREIATALVAAHVGLMLGQPAHWTALILLERRLSSLESYRQLYRHHVDITHEALAAAIDWPDGQQPAMAAFSVFTMADGLVRNALLTWAVEPRAGEIEAQVLQAVCGYLAYRG
ncbi:TetR/AcrR family transcriptional regulator [Comamonas composti]|uniref:TetR/AcrR family transcriptional regulator n=1 Tax=Comamonas composti TaxID=408558 RepID=UPI00042650EE|nr:TetR/AcrR family transcriptional regulator [Comamonas composti]